MKKSFLEKAIVVACLSIPSVSPAASFHELPKESGFDGFLLIGATSTQFSSNSVAGNSLTHVEHNSTNGLNDSPSSENGMSGVFTGELNYTFAGEGIQLYLGNELEDVLRYDLTTQFGVRKSLPGNGIASIAFLTSGVLPTHVYEDPFNVEQTNEADRDMNGVKLGWDNMFDKGISVEMSFKDIDVVEENSGQSLVDKGILTKSEQHLLDRTGTTTTMRVSYLHSFSSSHHIEPTVIAERADKDGEAIAHDRFGMSLSYFYLNGRFSLVSQMAYSYSEYDQINPVWNHDEVEDNNSIAASMVLSYARPFNWQDTSFVTSFAYGNGNSNIDFYDSDIATASIGMLYQF
ncbi:DUF2860 family protein [Vibrio maerlii]|uniref:DUF2860 family protein n=1 Tax=Vibrio maerlii TaxID=2231648 RepID=UPI0013DF18A0|nr:DUF2860 family protein [Vibrio maerlii]